MEVVIKEITPDGNWKLVYLVGSNNDNLTAELTTSDSLEEVIQKLSKNYGSLNRRLVTYKEYIQNKNG